MTSQLPPNKSMQDLMAQANDIASGPIPTPDQFAQQEGKCARVCCTCTTSTTDTCTFTFSSTSCKDTETYRLRTSN